MKSGIKGKLINTVHDSIVVDVAKEEVEKTIKLFEEVFKDLRSNVLKIYGFDLGLEVRCEILVGPNQKDLKEYE